jgi:heme/copper-type cytochrome/quinol oxidase subunit 1
VFVTGMPVTGQRFFMYATMLVAVPTGVKVFNWIATMWREGAEGLEWEVPSPAPFHTFERPPPLDAGASRVLRGHGAG